MFKKVLYFLIFYTKLTYASNIDNYVIKANSMELYKSKEWLSLVHYKKDIFEKYKSIITSDNFFTSKTGKNNPKTELEETIKSFFNKDYYRK